MRKRHTEFLERLKECRLMLPPLAGYTDYPYRMIMAEFNPSFICTEMISPKAVIKGNPRTVEMLRLVMGGHLNGTQLVGSDPVDMGEAAGIVESLGYDYVDVNMGCTDKAINNTGAGVSMMLDEEKACSVVSKVVESVSVPVTCKMRLGFSRDKLNAVSLAKGLVDAGVAALVVHGRTGEKRFGLPVDYAGIRAVVEAVDVPVIGNGGVYSGRDAVDMIDKTGSAGVMPGRGLIGYPWLILEVGAALSGFSYVSPSLNDRKTVCLRHLGLLCDFYGEQKGVVTMRRVLAKYFSGCRNRVVLNEKSQKLVSVGDVESLLDHICEDETGFVFYL